MGALLGFGLWSWGMRGGPAQTTEPIPGDLTGSALAQALGLELQSSWSSDCRHYVEIEEFGADIEKSGAGYCLDAAVTSNFDAWDVGQRLRGHEPTELDRQIFELADQIAQASEAGDTARVEELSAQLEFLMEQQQAEG